MIAFFSHPKIAFVRMVDTAYVLTMLLTLFWFSLGVRIRNGCIFSELTLDLVNLKVEQ